MNTRSKSPVFLRLLLLFLLLLPGDLLYGQAPENPGTQPKNEMALQVREYSAGLRDLYRGFHDRPYTAMAQKSAAYLDQWGKRLDGVPFDRLTQEGKVDYLLLKKNIQRSKYDLEGQQKIWEALQPAFPFTGQVMRLAAMRRWGSTPDAKAVAATYDSVGREISRLQPSLSKLALKGVTSLPLAMKMARSLQDNLRQVFLFYDGYNPAFSWWVETSYKKTDSLFSVYIDSLRANLGRRVASHDGSGIPGVPVGRKAVEQYLDFELIPYTPEELVQIANQEYDWSENEMKKASRAMGYGDDWKAALEKVKTDDVPVGEQPALIDSLQREALDFVAAKNLIQIPELAKETWTMKMMTPEEQRINPFFYGGVLISISYPTNTMSYEDKLMSIRGNNIYFSRATVFHELLPGHYLQAYMNERYKTYRRPFETAFWTEGWSFYWEMLLWDQGFDRTPEQKIGALYWRMTRSARIVFTINFHLGKWTPLQCVNYLVDSAGLERANAEAEVRRSFGGAYDPLYQIAYMMGALQFRALHKELVETGKMTNDEFHERILMENNMPIDMVRAVLEQIPLNKDYKTNWKFYAEIAPKK